MTNAIPYRSILMALALIPFAASAVAGTWYVNGTRGSDSNNGTGPNTAKKTIQSAINAAASGDTIVVAAGTYAPIDVRKPLTICGEGVESTFIDGGNTSRCAYFGGTDGYVLQKMALKNGYSGDNANCGGAMQGTLIDCIITNCHAYFHTDQYSSDGRDGGGTYNSILWRCKVMNCSAYNGGGSYGGEAYNCLFAGNTAQMTGGGAEFTVLYNCTFCNNVAMYGAAASLGSSGGAYNCIAYNNRSSSSSTYDNFWNGTVYSCHNANSDPGFVDAQKGNFRLVQGSACVDSGDNARVQGEALDLDGCLRIVNGRVDKGCYEYGADKSTVLTIRSWDEIGNLDYPFITDVVIAEGIGDIPHFAFEKFPALVTVSIPSSVTNIGWRAFANCGKLTSVTIPHGVTSIESDTFYNCTSLTSVTIPNSVTKIADSAFLNCSALKAVSIPDSVVYIGDGAFSCCKELTSVSIPRGVMSIANSAFSFCEKLTSVEFPNGVTNIGARAFYCCDKLESVSLPDGVLSIGDDAFWGCGALIDLKIPSSVKRIGEDAFLGCHSLTAVTIPACVTSLKTTFPYTYEITDVEIGEGRVSIEKDLLSGCSSLQKVVLPSSVRVIGDEAFSDCACLTSVNIPVGVTKIGASAFSGCEQLTSVEIPDGVTGISDRAFYGCCRLTYVKLPTSITSIGDEAFYDCVGIAGLAIPDCVTSIGYRAFYKCTRLLLASTSLSVVSLPPCLKDLGDEAFCRSGLTNVTIPASLTNVGNGVFDGCISLKSATIPSSVTNIGDRAFKDCSMLSSVTLQNGLVSIGESAFSGCSRLTMVQVPNTVISIGNSAFYYSGLEEIALSDSITNIGNDTFDGCYELESLTIPNGVTNIGERAFLGCSRMTQVSLPASVSSIGVYAFANCSRITRLTIPSCVASLSSTFSAAYMGIEEVGIDDGRTSIDKALFAGCSGLRKVFVPASVVMIADGAFPSGCQVTRQQFVNVDVSAEDQTITYDGLQHDSGKVRISCDVESFPLEDIKCAAGELHCDVGVYGHSLDLKDIVCVNVDEQYIVRIGISRANSQMRIVRRPVTVTSEGAAKAYDGTPLTHPVVTVGGSGFVADECTATAAGAQTAVGSSKNTVALAWADGASADNYTITRDEGTLTVTPRSVTVTTKSATKVFDGTPLRASGVTVGGSGFVAGECTASAAGAQTVVGSSKNTVALAWANGASAGNYTVTKSEGTLTVTPGRVAASGSEPGPGSVPSGGISKFDAAPVKYDGKGHTINVAALQTVTLAGSTPSFSYSLSKNGPFRSEPYTFTNAGETSLWYRVSAANYDDFVHEARVTILPREVTLTSGSASKNYDGTALTKKAFSVSGDGFVGTEGVTLTYTGSQTVPGTSANSFTYAHKSNTLAKNYAITTKNGTLTVGATGAVIVPEGTVTIAADLFKNRSDMTSITIPASLKTIGANAFAGCTGLKGVYITDLAAWCKISFGDNPLKYAHHLYLNGSEVKRLTIPAGVTSIGDGAFAGATAIERVRVPASVKTASAAVFSGCTAIRAVELGNASFLSLFTHSALTEIVFLDSVTSIPDGAASGCTSLARVSFPSAMRIRRAGLLRMGFSESIIDTFGRIGDFIVINKTLVKYVGDRQVTELVLPPGIEVVDDGVFKELFFLMAVEIPDTVEIIGDSAFEACGALPSLRFPAALTCIGARAFCDCTELTSVEIESPLEEIGEEAFLNCWKLDTLNLPTTLKVLGKNAFAEAGTDNLIGVTLPTHVVPLMTFLPSSSANIVEFTVSAGETRVMAGMFAGCEALEKVTFSGVETSIGDTAFAGCAGLREMRIPDSVAGIGREAFRGCVALELITMPAALTELKSGTFAECTSLTYVRLFASVAKIGASVFDKAKKLTRVYLMGNVAPAADPDVYAGAADDLETVVQQGSTGWYREGSPSLPPKNVWNARTIKYDTSVITVTFNAYGGTFDGYGETYVSQQTTDTAYVIPAERPVRKGYRFNGWYTSISGGSQVTEQTMVLAKTAQTLYARWTPSKTITVTFVPQFDGQMPGGVSEVAFETGSTFGADFARHKPTRHGWAFVGWFTAAEKGAGVEMTAASRVPDVDTTLYAHWEVAKYTVVFDKNDGTGARYPQAFVYNEWQPLLPNSYTWADHVFLGWSYTPGYDGTIDFSDAQQVDWNLSQDDGEEVVLYAQWSGDSYTVWFNANGGTGTMTGQTHLYGGRLPLKANLFMRDGYEFAGWSLTGGDSAQIACSDCESVSETKINPQRDNDVELYAVWVHEGTSRITVRFVPGTGAQLAEGETETRQYRVGDTYASGGSDDAFPGAIRMGYVMTGWWTAATGGERIDETDRIRAAVTTLYAQWEPIVYTVHYDANGGSGKMSDQEFTYDVAQGLRPNGFSKANCVFDGWTLKNTSTTYVNGQSVKNLTTVPNGIVTLVARWRTASSPTVTTYEVQLLPGEGSGAVCILAFDPGRVYKLKLASELSFRPPTGKTRFVGWAGSNDRRYDPGVLVFNLVPVGGTITLTAIWE